MQINKVCAAYRIFPIFLCIIVPCCKRTENATEQTTGEANGIANVATLDNEEQQLLAQRGTLQRRREELQYKRTRLLERKDIVDTEQGETLQTIAREEAELAQLAEQIKDQERSINSKLEKLLRKREELSQRAPNDPALKASVVRQQERDIARREKTLAEREATIAQREKDLASREDAFAKRQTTLCSPQQTVVKQVVKTTPGEGKYTRKDVETLYEKALAAMKRKGLISSDLPPGADQLMTQARRSAAKGDYTRGKFAAEQLLASVEAVKINREFVGGKIGRLSNLAKKRPPKKNVKAKVRSLFSQATSDYGNGNYTAANAKLNRIYALLR